MIESTEQSELTQETGEPSGDPVMDALLNRPQPQ